MNCFVVDRSHVNYPLECLDWMGPTQDQPMYVCIHSLHFLCDSHSLLGKIDAPLSLEPSSTVLHYAQTLFEGMKAYRHDKGKVTLFRPDMNMKRMNSSAKRVALPVSPPLAFFTKTGS